jgi:hypothetical protein
MKKPKREKPIRSIDEFRRRFYLESYARGDFDPKPEKILIIIPRPGV